MAHARIFVVTDGRAGMENQALGLAEALARCEPFDIEVHRISLQDPWRWLPGRFWGNPFDKVLTPLPLDPTPDIWIGCGRVTLPFAKAMRRMGSFVVQLQNPREPLDHFDLVVPPHHDRVHGENVLSMRGSPNRLTEEKLRTDAARLLPFISGLSTPRLAVMIGGDSKAYRFSEARQKELLDRLVRLKNQKNGLLITSSRRTPATFISKLREQFADEQVFQWHGDHDLKPGFNPYFGMLGLADHILVTEESTNMVTEAAFTGKPVHLIGLDGGKAKFVRFHKALQEAGITRSLTIPLANWTYTPLRETDRIARQILKRWHSQMHDQPTKKA